MSDADSAERPFELLENIPAGIIVIDPRGNVIYANPAWQELFGIDLTEQITHTSIAALDIRIAGTDEYYPDERRPIWRALRGEPCRASDVEVRLAKRTVVVDINARPVRDKHGAVVCAIASVTDITPRVRAEAAYRDLFENAPIGIYRTTPDWKVILINPALLRMLGHHSVEAFESAGGFAALDDRDSIHAALEEKREVRAREATWRRSDGTPIHVSENVRMMLSADRSVLHFEGTVEDVSARKDVERELRRSREQFRHLIENASDVIYRCDAGGIFRYVNASVVKILGYEESDLIGKHFTDFIDPEYRDSTTEFYLRQFRNKTPNTYFEFPVIRKDGARVWIGQNVQPVLTGQWVLGFQAVARDVSQRREMEAALAAARDAAVELARAKSEFVANISHEIRTPLNGVVGMTSLLERTSLSGEQREAAAMIRTSAEALLTLVDDVLDFSKIEAGKLEIRAEEFDLDELVDSVIDIFVERAAAREIKLRAIIHPGVRRFLVGDDVRLRQVLVNLAGNALKFTEAGEVSVTITKDDETDAGETTLRFLIQDTGIGISAEEQPRLFNLFMQGDGNSSRRFGGTGLGLAISKQLVEMMGGQIGVTSTPGEGSTFWFTLRFAAAEEQGAATGALSGKRALVIDSDAKNQLMLRRHLVSAGMTVETAFPADALTALRERSFDVAVVEMQLGETDGISMVREIRGEPHGAALPVVLISVIGRRKSDIDFFHAERIDAWVLKPVRRAQLTATVGRVLEDPSAVREEAASPALSDKRILVVEDNVINQTVALGQLRLLGYEPEVVSTGAAAIAAVKKGAYDLILLDCQMPGMDGYDVAAAIRSMENGERRTPIVAMTAHAAASEREKCLAAGMDDLVTKPVSMQRLGEVLSRWFGEKPAVVDEGKLAAFQILARANPAFMRDITGLFREDALLRLHEMRDAVAAGAAEALMRAAHALKSSSGNVGATRMYTIAATLEENAKSGDLEHAAVMIQELTLELDRATEALVRSGVSAVT